MHEDWVRVRQFLAHMPLTMEGLDVLSFRDTEDPKLARVFKRRRLEAILKAIVIELARGAGDKPMNIQMTYDPVASPHRPIYGPLYGRD